MKHYVYKLENPATKEFYYGSRTCNCNPEDDVYMGSMTRWKVDKTILTKTIIKSDFDNRILATEYEAALIYEHIKNPLNRNYHIPAKGFYGSPKGPRIKYHNFGTNKIMKQWCKDTNIKCKTKNGSDVDWNTQLYGKWKPNIKISIPEYTIGMSRESSKAD